MTPPPGGAPDLPEIDTTIPHPARVWDYWLGGRDNYAPDRGVGDQILQAMPGFADIARADREFLGRVVRHLAAEVGIRQFLDIGTGIPTVGNTHQVAQAAAPDARVVYVDNDPIVRAHAQALLTRDGSTHFVLADLREPDTILEHAAGFLDLDRPVALTLLGTVEFLPEPGDAQRIMRTLLAALAPGSHLAISFALPVPEVIESQGLWNASGATPLRVLEESESRGLFDGTELIDPGIVPLPRWRTAPDTRYLDRDLPYAGGVGRKP